MATNKSNEQFPKFSTPKGQAFFPSVVQPDQYDDNSEPMFKCDLRLDAESKAAKDLKAKADEHANYAYQEAVDNAKNKAAAKRIKKLVPYYMEEDEDGNETGYIIFRIRSNAYRKDKNGERHPRKIAVFDASGRPMDIESSNGLGFGSLVRVGGFFNRVVGTAMGSGASMKLQAVKVIEYQSPSGGASAEDFGFDEDESDEDEEDEDNDDDEDDEDEEDDVDNDDEQESDEDDDAADF